MTSTRLPSTFRGERKCRLKRKPDCRGPRRRSQVSRAREREASPSLLLRLGLAVSLVPHTAAPGRICSCDPRINELRVTSNPHLKPWIFLVSGHLGKVSPPRDRWQISRAQSSERREEGRSEKTRESPFLIRDCFTNPSAIQHYKRDV